MLPWVSERKLVTIADLMGPEEDWRRIYSDDVASMASVLARGFSPDTVNILMAHVYAAGAQTGASERSLPYLNPIRPRRRAISGVGPIHSPSGTFTNRSV